MKRAFSFFISLFLLLSLVGLAYADHESTIYLFYGKGCPHCAAVEEYFEENGFYEKYDIDVREIYFDRENAVFFNNLLDKLGVSRERRGVPTVVIGDKVLVGDRPIIENFSRQADGFLAQKQEVVDSSEEEHFNEDGAEKLDLTLAVVLAGSLVDAINPCAFAVLIILMTTILSSGDPGRALKAGISFSASIFISYFLMGLGIYKALAGSGVGSTVFQIAGWLAIVLGVLNLKDAIWYGKGFLMEVPMSWRPKLKALIGSVTNPVGAFFVGFLVSLFLLPCTSGPYVVILGMLSKEVLRVRAIWYLVVYNLVFVSPMLLISYLVFRGMSPGKAEEIRQRRLRFLHLVAGIVLLIMGLAIIRGWL